MLGRLFTVIGVFVFFARAAKLPPYIKPCRRTDPNFSKCALSRAPEAIAQIINGDKNFRLPTLKPFTLPEISIQASENLKLKLTDVTLTGLENMVVKEIKIDPVKRNFDVLCEADRLNLVGNSDINGKILILPISGKGPCNITFVGGTYHYNFNYDLINKKGKNYAVVKNPQIDFQPKRAYYYFENLFNGNKKLGEEMNTFLNENWKEVQRDLGPAVSETISSIVTSIISSYFTRIPFDELFLP